MLALAVTGCSPATTDQTKSSASGQQTPAPPTREQAKASGKNVGDICLALLRYEDQHREFPTRFTKTPEGGPALSWRVAILPFLGHEELYSQFKLHEPWNSPHNEPLIAKIPAVYRSPMTDVPAGATVYLAVENSVLMPDRSPRMAGISDGTSNTAVIVEANRDQAVPWTKPDDYSWTPDQPAAGLGQLHPKGAFIIGMASGEVRLVRSNLDQKTIAALFTRHGGEVVDWSAIVENNSKD